MFHAKLFHEGTHNRRGFAFLKKNAFHLKRNDSSGLRSFFRGGTHSKKLRSTLRSTKTVH